MSAFLEGWRRVLRAPAVTSGLLVGTMLMNVPITMTMRSLLGPGSHAIGVSYAGTGSPGWNGQWIDELGAQLHGLEWVFAHEILGFGGNMNITRLFLDSMAFGPLFWMLSVNVVLWMFVSGGVLDRLARDRPTRSAAFFSASGVHFFRFLRLDAILGVLSWVLLRFASGVLLWATTSTGSNSTKQAIVALTTLLLLTVISLVGDYAKARIVVEDRRSALGGVTAAFRFVVRHPLQTLALYLLNAVVMLSALALWNRVVIGQMTSEWLVVTVGAFALLLQILIRLSFMASTVALFQSKLAHAGYVAAPLPMWPDSPSAEALQNLVDRKNS